MSVPAARHLLVIATNHPNPWEPHKGPANANLVSAIRGLGCQVTVIAPVPWTSRFRERPSDRIQGDLYPIYWYVPAALREHYHHMLRWSLRTTLEKVARMQPAPQAVLAGWTHPDGMVAVQFGKAHGIPTGIIAGGSDIMVLPADPARGESVARTLRSADHIFGVGSEIGRRVAAFGVDPARISNLLRGVNLDQFVPGDQRVAREALGLPADAPLLLWVGNMVEVKAPERVILSARELAAEFPTLRLAMVGYGPQEAALRALAAGSGAFADRIIFPGPVPSPALPTWYQAATLQLLPSRSEGIPNVLVEGMATGLPFVASRVGSVADLLPFGLSQTVAEGDVAAMTNAIREILNSGPNVQSEPRRHDLLDGARHILHHLNLDRS